MKDRRTDQKRAYNEANYDRLAITIPKGQKAALQAHAESKGESINAMVNRVLLADMGLEEWPQRPEET